MVRAASPALLRVIALGAFFIYCTVSKATRRRRRRRQIIIMRTGVLWTFWHIECGGALWRRRQGRDVVRELLSNAHGTGWWRDARLIRKLDSRGNTNFNCILIFECWCFNICTEIQTQSVTMFQESLQHEKWNMFSWCSKYPLRRSGDLRDDSVMLQWMWWVEGGIALIQLKSLTDWLTDCLTSRRACWISNCWTVQCSDWKLLDYCALRCFSEEVDL